MGEDPRYSPKGLVGVDADDINFLDAVESCAVG